jgi:hypothetical protein
LDDGLLSVDNGVGVVLHVGFFDQLFQILVWVVVFGLASFLDFGHVYLKEVFSPLGLEILREAPL